MLRAVTFLMLVPVLLALSEPASPSMTPANPFVSAAFSRDCGSCFDCSSGGTVGHSFSAAPLGLRDGLPHGCYVLDCLTDYHPECGTDNLDLVMTPTQKLEVDLLEAALRTSNGSAKELQSFLRRFPERAVLNAERGVLQVVAACSKDRIIAQVPLSESQLRATEASALVTMDD